MHIADMEGRNLGANGVVGGGIPMAVGVGLGLKIKQRHEIILSFFGEGAASGGAFHESMELAVLFQVPVVFVCENNQYAMSFPARKWTTSERLAKLAEVYGMPGQAVDGNDLLAVREAVSLSAEEAERIGVIDMIATDLDDLLIKLDGREVKVSEVRFTPDGRHLTYLAKRDKGKDEEEAVWIIPVAGGESRKLLGREERIRDAKA